MAGIGTSLRRTGRGILQVGVTAAVIGLSIAAVLVGTDVIADRAAAVPQPPAAPLTPVAVARVMPEAGFAVTRRFIGQVEAPGRIDLAFELGGRVVEILAEEGDRVSQGTALARLDIAALRAQRAALEAERAALQADLELARLTMDRNEQLARSGFRSDAARDDSRLAVARVTARIAALDAQIAGVDVQIGKSTLAAPFAAVIGSRHVDPGQTVATGVAVLRLFEQSAPQLRVGLPVALADRVSIGDAVTVEVGGQRLGGHVLRVRADLDPATRTRALVVGLPENTRLAFGQTGSLVFEEEVAEAGFWAPVAALREGARGSWTVLTVRSGAAGDVVVPAAVEVIHMAGDRVFLRGTLPEGASIVARAPGRVAPGQVVAVVAE